MCVELKDIKNIVREELRLNNEKRDAAFDAKQEKFQEKIEKLVNKIVNDKTKALLTLPEKCAKRGESLSAMTNELKNLSEKIDKMTETHDKHIGKLEQLMAEQGKTYAKKWVEKYFALGIVIVCTAVLGAVLGLVIIKH